MLSFLLLAAVCVAAMGSNADDMDKVTDRTVLSSDAVYYRFNPRISLVAPEMAARDTAAFWNPAPVAATTARAGGPRRERRMQR